VDTNYIVVYDDSWSMVIGDIGFAAKCALYLIIIS
jgi:hypothetical protein